MDSVLSVTLQVTMAMKFEPLQASFLLLTRLWFLVLLGLPVDDEQHQSVAQKTEEEHKVEEDGQLGAEVVVVGGVARRDHGVAVVVLRCCACHF